MGSELYCRMILTLIFFNISVNCFPSEQKSLIPSQQVTKGQLYLNRFRRQSPVLGSKNYMQETAVQPSVVVMSSGVPNTVYRGAPTSSYGVQSSPYAVQGASYGANRVPTVVVNMPEDNYITPAVNPYAVQPRRL